MLARTSFNLMIGRTLFDLMLTLASFCLMLGLALMSVHSSMAGILPLVVPRVISLASLAVQSFWLL